MKIGGENIVPFLLLLGTGLALSNQQLDDEYDAEDDSDAIVFEDDLDVDAYLEKEMAKLEKEKQAFEEEKKAYLKELDDFRESKTHHEAEKAELGSVFQRKMKEYADTAKANEERFQTQLQELDKEVSDLDKLELELQKEEEELEQLERVDKESGKELVAQSERLHSSEAELKKKKDEYQTLLQTQARTAQEEEKRLKAIYGDCELVPESFRNYLKVFDEEYTRLCYKVTEDDS